MKKLFLSAFILSIVSLTNTLQAQDAYAMEFNGILTFYYDGFQGTRSGVLHKIEAEYIGDENFPSWCGSDISKVVFDDSFAEYTPSSTARWFHSCSCINEIMGLANLNTSKVISMSSMFYGCSALKRLDLSSLNTSSVTDMSTMFFGCSGLTNLDLYTFDTSNVTRMTAMFYGCTGLIQLNVSSFNTSKVEDMQYMFFKCSQLSSMDLSDFDTYMVKNMEAMFGYGEALISLDLSSFNTCNVTNMELMFSGCSVLQTIYVSDGWTVENVLDGKNLFFMCTNLVGGNGTQCDGYINIGIEYAYVDTDTRQGFFTYKNAVIINEINTNSAKKGSNWFTVSGVQHPHPQKGINIHNREIIIVK